MAVKHPSAVRKPSLGLPDMAFSHTGFENRHPPVIIDKDQKADHPADQHPNSIIYAEEKQPKAAVLAGFLHQLHIWTAAPGTSLIDHEGTLPFQQKQKSLPRKQAYKRPPKKRRPDVISGGERGI